MSAEQLDNYLQGLPRFLPIDDVSAIDVTIVQDPLISPTFLSVGVRGEFTSLGNSSNFTFPDHGLQPGLFCSDSTKMVTIALCDYVINSAANVYYEVHALQTCYIRHCVHCISLLSSLRTSLRGVMLTLHVIYFLMFLCPKQLYCRMLAVSGYCSFRTTISIWCVYLRATCVAEDLLSLVMTLFEHMEAVYELLHTHSSYTC